MDRSRVAVKDDIGDRFVFQDLTKRSRPRVLPATKRDVA